MMRKIFTGNMKLADLIATNHNLILMMPRFGIPLGFGEKSVAEVCRAHDIPVDFMLLVCNAYTFDNFLPDTELLGNTDMRPLVPYLQASHRYYLDDRIPHIDNHLHHVADLVGGRVGEMLKKFFDDYSEEIADHFQYEEQDAFPYLLLMQSGKKSTRNSAGRIASRFAESHGNIDDKLSDLTQIVYKYLPSDIASEESIELIFDILQLSEDLKKHELIEEKILLPYGLWLEEKR
jgi:regulator of cell morphogenesis and NO signaling